MKTCREEGGTLFDRTHVLGNFRLALENANLQFPPGDFWSGTFGEFFAAIDKRDANLQDVDGRSQIGSGFSRHPRVKFHPSVQIPTL